MSKPKPLILSLRARQNVGYRTDYCQVWLTEGTGPFSGLLHGELLPSQLEQLAAALGLPVVWEGANVTPATLFDGAEPGLTGPASCG